MIILPGRYILACNHERRIDGFLIYLHFLIKKKTKLAIFAAEKYFNVWWSAPFIKYVDCIMVPKEDSKTCLDEAMKEKKRPFLFFIEGKVVNQRGKAKTGCVRLSKRTGLPIYPIRIQSGKIITGPRFEFTEDEDIKVASERLLDVIYSLVRGSDV